MSIFSRSINLGIEWIDRSSFEIVGTLDDNVHSLTARFVVGFPDFVIREASGDITRMPYTGYCEGSLKVLPRLVGERIGRGFRKRAAAIVGGAESCNHLHTLVINMSACAFQMNYVAAKQRPEATAMMRETADDPGRRRQIVLEWMPQLRDSCYVFSESSDQLFQIEPVDKPSEDPAST
jgi:DUF2889 family protein